METQLVCSMQPSQLCSHVTTASQSVSQSHRPSFQSRVQLPKMPLVHSQDFLPRRGAAEKVLKVGQRQAGFGLRRLLKLHLLTGPGIVLEFK